RVEMLTTGPARRYGPACPNLSVDSQHSAHLRDEIGQRRVEPATQRGELAAQRGDAPIAPLRVAARRARVADRIGKTGAVSVGPGLCGDPLQRRRFAARPVELRCAPPQRRNVATTEPPPRAG